MIAHQFNFPQATGKDRLHGYDDAIQGKAVKRKVNKALMFCFLPVFQHASKPSFFFFYSSNNRKNEKL